MNEEPHQSESQGQQGWLPSWRSWIDFVVLVALWWGLWIFAGKSITWDTDGSVWLAAAGLWSLWNYSREERWVRRWRERMPDRWVARGFCAFVCVMLYTSIPAGAWRWAAVAIFVSLYAQFEWYIWRRAGDAKAGLDRFALVGAYAAVYAFWEWLVHWRIARLGPGMSQRSPSTLQP